MIIFSCKQNTGIKAYVYQTSFCTSVNMLHTFYIWANLTLAYNQNSSIYLVAWKYVVILLGNNFESWQNRQNRLSSVTKRKPPMNIFRSLEMPTLSTVLNQREFLTNFLASPCRDCTIFRPLNPERLEHVAFHNCRCIGLIFYDAITIWDPSYIRFGVTVAAKDNHVLIGSAILEIQIIKITPLRYLDNQLGPC